MRNILILMVAVMSLLGSCTKGIQEQGGGEHAPGTVQVQLTLPNAQPMKTRAIDGTAAENFVGNVQMLFWNDRIDYRARYLSIDPKKPVVDVETVWNPATGTLTIRNAGFSNCVIYVMVNGKGDELSKNFKNRAEILDVIAEHSGAIIDPATDPLPMSGISPKVNFNDENTTQVTVELHRMVAKVNVTVNLDADFLKAYPDCVFGTAAGQEAALKLVNIPSKSYVFQKTPIVIPLTAVDANNISDMIVKENGTGKDMTWTTTAYVFENPAVDPATSMKIGLYLPYKDGTNPAATSNYYQLLEVNNTATADRVKRNWIYNMTVTVNGFGKENVTVNTMVEPWNVENIDIPVDGSYVRFNTEKVILKHKGINTVKVLSSLAMDKFTVSVSNATNTLLTQTGSDLELKALFTDFNAQTEYKKLGTLTVTSKEDPKLTHTIDVFYEPIVFAGFDIVLGADNTYKIGSEATHKDVLLFNAASNIGAKAADLPTGTGALLPGWTTAHTYYTPNANPQIAATPASGKDYTYLRQISRRSGDPCKSVNDTKKWRTPTHNELKLLLGTPQSNIGRNETRVYNSKNVRGWLYTAEFNLFITWDIDNIKAIPFIWHSGYSHDTLRGSYRWSSEFITQNGIDRYYSILTYLGGDASKLDGQHTAIQDEAEGFLFPVRCVRDFSDKY